MNQQAVRDVNISITNFKNHIEARKAELGRVATKLGPLNSAYVEDHINLKTAFHELEDRKGSVGGRPVHVYFENQLVFWFIVIVVAVSEVFANKELFDMIFLGTVAKSLFVALVLSVSLVGLSHWSGFSWRQIWSESEQKWMWSSFFIGLLTLIVVAIAILSLMIVRAYFANSSGTAGSIGDIFGGLVEQVAELGFIGLVWQAFASIEALALGVFNLMCVVVAFVIGFLSHDSDINYDKCHIARKKAESKLKKTRSRYEKSVDGVHRKFAKKIDLARQAFVTAKSHAEHSSVIELPKDDFAADRLEVESGGKLEPLPIPRPEPSPTPKAPNKRRWHDWGTQ